MFFHEVGRQYILKFMINYAKTSDVSMKQRIDFQFIWRIPYNETGKFFIGKCQTFVEAEGFPIFPKENKTSLPVTDLILRFYSPQSREKHSSHKGSLVAVLLLNMQLF